jgi:PilZ domain
MAVNSPEAWDLDESAEPEFCFDMPQGAFGGEACEAVAACCFSQGMADVGLTLSLRSADAYRAEGDRAGARRVLSLAMTHTGSQSPRSVVLLARALARAGRLAEAADLMVAAAERARIQGCVEQSLEFCLAAARWCPGVRDVHRTWTLALLASGDPNGALGHLADWGGGIPEQWEAIRPELEVACGAARAAELIARAQRLAEPENVQAAHALSRGRAFLAPGLDARRGQLVRALTQADIDVVESSCDGGIAEALVGALPLDLLILPIAPDRCPRHDWFRRLQSHPGLQGVPILGALAGELDVDRLEALRALGLAGVVDLGAATEHIEFRVRRILRRDGFERRVHTRVAMAIDVSVDAGGTLSNECILNLSSGGLRLWSSRPLEVNQEIRLRFRPQPEAAFIRANARVVNCMPAPSGEPRHSIGVFFLDLSASDRERIDALVAQRLAGSETQREPVAACEAGQRANEPSDPSGRALP